VLTNLDQFATRTPTEILEALRSTPASSQKQWNSIGQNSFGIDLAHQWRFAMPVTDMKDHVYKILELVGSSEKSIEDAIQNAITRASKTIRGMKWFEVVQTRGHIENGSIRHYQVTLRVGFTLER